MTSRDPVAAALQTLTQKVAELQRLYERLKGQETIPVINWTTWTPTITQSGSVTFTNTYCRYMVIEKLATVQFTLAVTSAGMTANPIIVGSIPAAIAPVQASLIVGAGLIVDSGTANFPCVVQVLTAATLRFVDTETGGRVGENPAFALASGDFILGEAKWEIA